MKRIKIEKMSSLQDIALEKERHRRLALKTEIELKEQIEDVKQIFAVRNILYELKSQSCSFLKNSVMRIFRKKDV
ncbi:MAG: hypothetical protein WBJ84_00775 [Bacteroidales bacterium]